MSMTLTDAKAALAKLSFSNLAWIYRKAQGDKPPVGTSKATLLETMTEMFEEKAKAENGAATTEASIECETWLGEVGGDGKPSAKKTEAPEAKSEKPIKLKKEKAPNEAKPRDERLPAVGETITKEWRGRKLEVKCLSDGFEFEGRTYRSLSKIASELLGCSANGFLTFGLTAGAKAAAARRAEREAAKATEAAKEQAPAPKPEKKKATKAGKPKSAKKKTSKK